jgi:hypothetical protein
MTERRFAQEKSKGKGGKQKARTFLNLFLLLLFFSQEKKNSHCLLLTPRRFFFFLETPFSRARAPLSVSLSSLSNLPGKRGEHE